MKKRKVSILCIVVEVSVIGIFCVGLFLNTGSGSLSAFGFPNVFALCPLGAVTSFIASKTLVPQQIIAAILFVAVIILVGRAFCGWACPVQLWYRLFNRDSKGMKKSASPKKGVPKSKKHIFGVPSLQRQGGIHDSRNWVLTGALVAAFAVSFPVFCLICPVGLTFASIVSVWSFIHYNTFSIGVVLFPAILLFELLVLRRWCHTLCPLGAVLSWISRANKTFVPQVAADSCVHCKNGVECNKCSEVCPEQIDLHDVEKGAPMHECTKCHLCAEACPVSAISFPFLRKKADAHPSTEAVEEQAAAPEMPLDR